METKTTKIHSRGENSWKSALRRLQPQAVLSATAASAMAQEQQDVEKAKHDRSSSPMGRKNQPLHDETLDSVWPPNTDHSNVLPFKYPFSYSYKRVEEGGWACQVTVQDLPVSTTIAGVSMRRRNGRTCSMARRESRFRLDGLLTGEPVAIPNWLVGRP